MAEPARAPAAPEPAASDRAAGFVIGPAFERFAQRNDIYRRSFWDPTIRSPKTERFYRTYREPLAEWRRADGFTQRDYALRNAAWHVSDLFTEARRDQDRREGFSDPYTQQLPPAAERQAHQQPGREQRERAAGHAHGHQACAKHQVAADQDTASAAAIDQPAAGRAEHARHDQRQRESGEDSGRGKAELARHRHSQDRRQEERRAPGHHLADTQHHDRARTRGGCPAR